MEPTAAPDKTAETNGKPAGKTIEVHNPATGELIGTVAACSPDDVAAMVERARAAQPAWEALGFDERGRILRRMQKWTLDNAERIIDTIVTENGKTYEDAQLAEVSYAASAFGFWAKNAPKYLADEKVKSASPFVLGRKLVVRYAPIGVVGVIGPWNYPLTNSLRRLHPGARRRQLGRPQAGDADPDDVAPDAPRGCANAASPRTSSRSPSARAAAIGNALIDAVDFIMFTGSTEVGKKVMARAGETLTGGRDGARRQGPDDRPPRRQPRARRQRRRPLLDAERRPDLHLGRARLRRGAGLRRRSSPASPRRCAALRQGVPGGTGRRRRRRDDLALADRPRRGARQRRGRQGRPRGRRRQARRAARATSSSRPCCSTSTTRWRR